MASRRTNAQCRYKTATITSYPHHPTVLNAHFYPTAAAMRADRTTVHITGRGFPCAKRRRYCQLDLLSSPFRPAFPTPLTLIPANPVWTRERFSEGCWVETRSAYFTRCMMNVRFPNVAPPGKTGMDIVDHASCGRINAAALAFSWPQPPLLPTHARPRGIIAREEEGGQPRRACCRWWEISFFYMTWCRAEPINVHHA